MRDGSVAEADCGNGCQDCQDYSSQDDETRPSLWLDEWELYWHLLGWAFMAIFSWSAIWKCCNNNLKTIGIWDIKSKPLIYSSSNVLNFSFLSIDVCLTWHGNYLFSILPQYVHLMMIYTGPVQGPESQHHKFHVHLHDDIERGFLNLNRFHDQVKGLSLNAMMSPGQLTLS